MRKTAFLLAILFAALSASAQPACPNGSQYKVISERPNEKSYVGILCREALMADTSFTWYADNAKGYTLNADAVANLKKNADSVELIAFMGTWCEDSHFIIPKLYMLADAAGYPANRITLVGVDRNKTTLGHLAAALHIKNVPTIMVMKNGKELGRVIEYGKYGLFDRELGEIISKAAGN